MPDETKTPAVSAASKGAAVEMVALSEFICVAHEGHILDGQDFTTTEERARVLSADRVARRKPTPAA